MSHAEFELLKAILFGILAGYLWRLSQKENVREERLWNYFFVGFALILAGFFVGMTKDFPSLNRFIVLGNTPYASILKNGILHPIGFISVFLGIAKLLPFLDRLRKVEIQLNDAVSSLEKKVLERTSDLLTTNEQLTKEIEERKRTEVELRQSEERLSLALDSANLGVWDWDLATGKGLWTERIHRMLGYDLNEIESDLKNWKRLVHPDDWPTVSENLNLHLEGRAPLFDIEHRILNRAGDWQWVQGRGKVVGYSPDGKPTRMSGVITDISRRKKAEEALRDSEERYRMNFENARDVIFSFDAEFEVIDVTPSIERTLGYSPIDLFGKRFTDLKLLEPSSLLASIEDARRVLGGETIESRIYFFNHEDGTTRVGEVSASPLMRDGLIVGVTAVARDITDRWHAEKALKLSEEKYRSIIENIEEGYYEVDIAGNMRFCNDAMCKVLGYSRDELIGMNNRQYMDESTADQVFSTFNSVYRTGHPVTVPSWRLITKDGSTRSSETSISLIRDSHGKSAGFRGIVRDVTERIAAEEALRKAYDELEFRVEERTRELTETNEKLGLEIQERQRAEEELRESEKRYRLLAGNVDDIIWTMDVNLRQTYCSPSVERMRGFTVEEAVGQSLEEILAPSSYELALKTLSEARPTLRGTDYDKSRKWSLELELICKDGGTIWTEMNISTIWDDDRLLELLGVARDITERRKAQKQLESSLAEKEILLKEIHHRVKNNLQVMSSLLALQSTYYNDENVHKACKDSERRVWSMALVHETLYISGNLAKIDTNQYLVRLVEDLMTAHSVDVGKVDLSMEIESLSLNVDTAVNCGLIANELLSNCLKHAFPEGRKGEIKLSLRTIGGDEVELAVKDNGVGMPVGLESRNIRSFGLDLVNMLADELTGKIEINSEGGTEFRITFPK